jgi:hypothetical protein
MHPRPAPTGQAAGCQRLHRRRSLRSRRLTGTPQNPQAGSRAVAGSDPDAEYRETLMKAGALLDAAGMAEDGLV